MLTRGGAGEQFKKENGVDAYFVRARYVALRPLQAFAMILN